MLLCPGRETCSRAADRGTHCCCLSPPPILLLTPQEKHVETAKQLLGEGPDLTAFVSRLMDDVGNLKAMLQAICIGELGARGCFEGAV